MAHTAALLFLHGFCCISVALATQAFRSNVTQPEDDLTKRVGEVPHEPLVRRFKIDDSNISETAEGLAEEKAVQDEDEKFADPPHNVISAEDIEEEQGLPLGSSKHIEATPSSIQNVTPEVAMEAGYVDEERHTMYRGPIEFVVDAVLLPLLVEFTGLAATLHFISQTLIAAGLIAIGTVIVYVLHKNREKPVRGIGTVLCGTGCFCCGGFLACFYPIDEKSTAKYYTFKKPDQKHVGGEWVIDSDDDEEAAEQKTSQPPKQQDP